MATLDRWVSVLAIVVAYLTNPGAVIGAPEVFVLHQPIHPAASQAVTYNVKAKDDRGLSAIAVFEQQEKLKLCPNGQHGCSDVILPSREIGKCQFVGRVTTSECAVTVPVGYADNSLIRYRARATNIDGISTDDGEIYFTAGKYDWPDDPIPIYVRGAPEVKIDLVFIPDKDYGIGSPGFMDDVGALVKESLFSEKLFASKIRDRREMWNLYITYQQGDAEPYCNRVPPPNWAIMSATVDSGFIVHKTDLTDCSGLGPGSTFSAERISSTEARFYVVPIHELGHSVFSLADEYRGGGLFASSMPEHNLFIDRATCEANAANHGWPLSNCKRIRQTNYWRSDGDGDLMENTSSTDHVPGPSDAGRYEWWYQNCGAGNC